MHTCAETPAPMRYPVLASVVWSEGCLFPGKTPGASPPAMKAIGVVASLVLCVLGCSSSSTPSSGGSDSGPGKDSSSGCATPDPITGTWKGVDITCAGQPAPKEIQAVYTAPNSVEYDFSTSTSGSQVVGTAVEGKSCSISIHLTFSYPSPGNLVITNGATTCSPSGCSPDCDTVSDGGSVPDYSYVVTGSDCNTLVLTSTNDNLICANPVVITATRE